MSVSAFQQRARYSSEFIIYILGQVGNEALNPKEGLSQFGILSYEMKKRVSGVFWREMKSLDPCNPVRGMFLFNGDGEVSIWRHPKNWHFSETQTQIIMFSNKPHQAVYISF